MAMCIMRERCIRRRLPMISGDAMVSMMMPMTVCEILREENEQSGEDGFREEVEDPVEDALPVEGDYVSGFGDTPADWVE